MEEGGGGGGGGAKYKKYIRAREKKMKKNHAKKILARPKFPTFPPLPQNISSGPSLSTR